MTVRICHTHGAYHGRRCPHCDRARGSSTARGYDTNHRRMRQLAITQQPWCSHCGTPGTESNPLTADHIIPQAAGGTTRPDNYQVLCRRCNSAKGTRRIAPEKKQSDAPTTIF